MTDFTLKEVPELEAINEADIAPDDESLVYDTSVGVVKRVSKAQGRTDRVTPINSVASLPNIDLTKLTDRQSFFLVAFGPNGSHEGGPLYWDASEPRTNHDGRNVFSPTVPAPADFNNDTDVQNYRDGVGDAFPGNNGCFIRAGFDQWVIPLPDITSLSSLNTAALVDGQGFRVVSTGRAGDFAWRSGDQSANVTVDPRQGIWVAPSSDPTGASGAFKRIYEGAPKIEWFDVSANGVDDDGAAFNGSKFLNTPVELKPGGTYAVGEQVAATADGQGFFCRGKAEVVVLAGTGQFDRADYTGSRFDSNAMPFYCLGFDDYVFKGIHVRLQTGQGVRTVGALSVRNCVNADIDIEVSAFTEPQNGIVNLDTISDSKAVINGHDIGTSNDTLASMQVTVCDIDNNPVGGVPSTNSTVVAFGKNILLSGAALTKYGQQTDGVNISNSGGECHGLEIVSKFESVGEPFDCFASYVKAYVEANDVKGGGAVKLIHGARHNRIKCVCGTTVGPAVVFAGSNIASQTVAFNYVDLICTGVGSASGAPGIKGAVVHDGTTATFKPEHNYSSVVASNGGDMDYVAYFEAGNDNVSEYIYDSVQTRFPTKIQASTGPGCRGVDRAATKGGYKIGRYYGGGILDMASTAPVSLSANTLYATPFIVSEAEEFTTFHFVVSTAAAGSARGGIYTWEKDGEPGDLVIDIGQVDVSTTGLKDISINSGNGVTLAAGPYVLAIVTDVSISVYSTASTSRENVNFIGAANFGGSADARITASHTFGALPATFPAVSYDANAIPNIALRANN